MVLHCFYDENISSSDSQIIVGHVSIFRNIYMASWEIQFLFSLDFDIFINQLINKILQTSKYTLFGNVHQGIYTKHLYGFTR